jgi:hypothetical protein
MADSIEVSRVLHSHVVPLDPTCTLWQLAELLQRDSIITLTCDWGSRPSHVIITSIRHPPLNLKLSCISTIMDVSDTVVGGCLLLHCVVLGVQALALADLTVSRHAPQLLSTCWTLYLMRPCGSHVQDSACRPWPPARVPWAPWPSLPRPSARRSGSSRPPCKLAELFHLTTRNIKEIEAALEDGYVPAGATHVRGETLTLPCKMVDVSAEEHISWVVLDGTLRRSCQ